MIKIAFCRKWVPDPAPAEVSPFTAVFNFLHERRLLTEDTPTDGEAPNAARG